MQLALRPWTYQYVSPSLWATTPLYVVYVHAVRFTVVSCSCTWYVVWWCFERRQQQSWSSQCCSSPELPRKHSKIDWDKLSFTCCCTATHDTSLKQLPPVLLYSFILVSSCSSFYFVQWLQCNHNRCCCCRLEHTPSRVPVSRPISPPPQTHTHPPQTRTFTYVNFSHP